ncbi:MAG: bifunctional adenosylcobinamide kinase/adenosylcobinamide-phosphate guanylyltransferase [Thermodesulfobacteriota bacterium]
MNRWFTVIFKTGIMDTMSFEHGCMLVLGGAKSGKSRFAMDACNALARKSIFLATAQALDREMEERILRHRSERGSEWLTVEEPIELASAIRTTDKQDTVILVDCLTLWLNNLFMKYRDEREKIDRNIDDLVNQLSYVRGVVVVVSNEVGMGIVPEDELSRRYRDAAGLLNQRVAGVADRVVAILAGQPLVVKDSG